MDNDQTQQPPDPADPAAQADPTASPDEDPQSLARAAAAGREDGERFEFVHAGQAYVGWREGDEVRLECRGA